MVFCDCYVMCYLEWAKEFVQTNFSCSAGINGELLANATSKYNFLIINKKN